MLTMYTRPSLPTILCQCPIHSVNQLVPNQSLSAASNYIPFYSQNPSYTPHFEESMSQEVVCPHSLPPPTPPHLVVSHVNLGQPVATKSSSSHLFQKGTSADKRHRISTGRMSFLSPNQQCQITEGNSKHWPSQECGGRKHHTSPMVLPPGESLCWHYLCLADCGQTRCHPQNRKYITYCTVVRGGPSHGHS